MKVRFYLADAGDDAADAGWYAVLNDEVQTGPWASEALARAGLQALIAEAGSTDALLHRLRAHTAMTRLMVRPALRHVTTRTRS